LHPDVDRGGGASDVAERRWLVRPGRVVAGVGEVVLDDVIDLVPDIALEPQPGPADERGRGPADAAEPAGRGEGRAGRGDQPARVDLDVPADVDVELVVGRVEPQSVEPPGRQSVLAVLVGRADWRAAALAGAMERGGRPGKLTVRQPGRGRRDQQLQ